MGPQVSQLPLEQSRRRRLGHGVGGNALGNMMSTSSRCLPEQTTQEQSADRGIQRPNPQSTELCRIYELPVTQKYVWSHEWLAAWEHAWCFHKSPFKIGLYWSNVLEFSNVDPDSMDAGFGEFIIHFLSLSDHLLISLLVGESYTAEFTGPPRNGYILELAPPDMKSYRAYLPR